VGNRKRSDLSSLTHTKKEEIRGRKIRMRTKRREEKQGLAAAGLLSHPLKGKKKKKKKARWASTQVSKKWAFDTTEGEKKEEAGLGHGYSRSSSPGKRERQASPDPAPSIRDK